MSLFFYLITSAISLCMGNSSQQTLLQCLSTIDMVFSDEDKILIKKKFVFKGVQKRGRQTNFKGGQFLKMQFEN